MTVKAPDEERNKVNSNQPFSTCQGEEDYFCPRCKKYTLKITAFGCWD